MSNELINMLTVGYDSMRAVIEMWQPQSEYEAECKERELRRLEWLFEATAYHFENSVAIEQILEANK